MTGNTWAAENQRQAERYADTTHRLALAESEARLADDKVTELRRERDGIASELSRCVGSNVRTKLFKISESACVLVRYSGNIAADISVLDTEPPA